MADLEPSEHALGLLRLAGPVASGWRSAGCQTAGGFSKSIVQPAWSPDGVLYLSDRNGWWRLYRLDDTGEVETVCEMKAEFGMPQWVFGMSSYAFESVPNRLWLHSEGCRAWRRSIRTRN